MQFIFTTMSASVPFIASPHPQSKISVEASISESALAAIDTEVEAPAVSLVSFVLAALTGQYKLRQRAEQAQRLAMMSEKDLSEKGLKRDEAVHFVFDDQFHFD